MQMIAAARCEEMQLKSKAIRHKKNHALHVVNVLTVVPHETSGDHAPGIRNLEVLQFFYMPNTVYHSFYITPLNRTIAA
jgi:hypothetical protein